MGCCFASRSKAETLIMELKQKKEEIYEFELKLSLYDGNIREMQKPSDMNALESEHHLSLQNLARASSLFPSINLNIEANISSIDWVYPIAKPYIISKLKITELESKIIKQLENLGNRLKHIESHKNHVNNSTIETMTRIIQQAELADLKLELDEIKKQQIELSSFQGGSLHDLLRRIEQRCSISKQLEIIQSKIESAQYLQDIDNIVSNAEDMNEELAELVDKMKNIEETCQSLKAKLQDVSKDEVLPLDEKIEDLDKVIKNTATEIKARKSFRSTWNNKIEEISRLSIRLNYCNTEIDLLELKNSDIKKQLEISAQAAKVINRMMKKVDTRNKTLNELENQKEKLIQENQKISEESQHDKDERALQMEKSLTDVASISSQLNKNLEESLKRKNSKLRSQVALRLFHSLKECLEHWLWRWKLTKYYKSFDSTIIPRLIDMETIDQEFYKLADDFIAEENELILNSENVLSKCMDFQGVKSLDSLKLFKFLEEIMDKKYEMDVKDISEGMLPIPVPDFVYRFTNGIFGIQKSAERHISRILLSLKELSEQGHNYASFFCSLFQVFTAAPAYYLFSIFLTRARYDFQSIIYKYEKKAAGYGNRGKSMKSKEYLEKGGLASLSDVVDLVTSIFENNKTLGMLAFQMIKPQTITSEEFITFLICQKVARMNHSIESIFLAIDKDASETIDLGELASFTRTSMDVWISDLDLNACFKHLVEPGTNSIHHDVFCETFSANFFTKANDSERYLVSKVNFLQMLTDLYRSEFRKQAASIFSILDYYPDNIGKQEFLDLVQRLDQSFAKDAERLFVENMQVNGKIKPFELVGLVMRLGIGNWKNNPFSVFEIIRGLSERDSYSFRRSFLCYSSSDISMISPESPEII